LKPGSAARSGWRLPPAVAAFRPGADAGRGPELGSAPHPGFPRGFCPAFGRSSRRPARGRSDLGGRMAITPGLRLGRVGCIAGSNKLGRELMTPPNASSHMDRALELARAAADLGEVPVGAVIAGPAGAIIAEAHNLTRARKDPTAHAEMLVIQQAAQVL